MKFAVLGAGNVGKANSAFLMHTGNEVVLYDRKQERTQPLQNNGLKAGGVVEGVFPVAATNDLAYAVKGARVILVCTTAAGHRPLAHALRGKLEKGQVIVITNCCWGAAEFDLELGAEAEAKECLICETSGQLILCSSPAPEEVYLKTVKQKILLSCVHPERTGEVLELLNPVFPQFDAAASVLETSLNNANPVAHGPLALFNITRMENGEDYLLFSVGATRGVTRFMEKIDRERVQVVTACGVPAPRELDLMNSFWGTSKGSLYEIMHETKAYSVTKGPKTLEHRYITEDLPYGLVPYVKLGKKFGIATPYLEALIGMLSLYMDVDYMAQGPEVEKMDLARYIRK